MFLHYVFYLGMPFKNCFFKKLNFNNRLLKTTSKIYLRKLYVYLIFIAQILIKPLKTWMKINFKLIR